MPRVPVYDTTQVNQRPLAPQYEDVRKPNELAGVGEGLQHVGASVEKASGAAAEIYRHEFDKANAENVFGAVSDVHNGWVQPNIVDSQTGYLSKLGQNAIGSDPNKPEAQRLLEDFDSYVKDRRSKLGNDDQRTSFDKVMQSERDMVARQIMSHATQQAQQVGQEKYESTLKSTASAAADFYNDPPSVQAQKQLGEGAILARSRQEGWPVEEFNQKLLEYQSRLHLGVLDRMTTPDQKTGLIPNLQAAADYLKANEKEIGSSMRVQSNIDKIIAHAQVQQVSAAKAGEIFSSSGGNYEKMQAGLQQIEDPNIRDATQERLGKLLAEDEHIRTLLDKQPLGRITQQIEADGYLDRNSKDYVNLSDDGKGKALVHARLKKIEDGHASAEERRAQQEENQFALKDFAAIPDVHIQANANLAQMYPKADRVTLATLTAIQNRAKKDTVGGGIIKRAEFDDMVKSATVNLPKELARNIQQEMLKWRAGYDQEPHRDDARKKIAEIVGEYKVPGWLWDSTKHGYEMSPEERAKATPLGATPASVQPSAASPIRSGNFNLDQPSKPAEVIDIPGVGRMPMGDARRITAQLKAANPNRKVSAGEVFDAYAQEQKGAAQ